MERECITPRLHDLGQDQIYGLSPDGEDEGQPESLYPAYPDLPYPEPGNRWEYNSDPLIHDEEATPRQIIWDPEDPFSPWGDPHVPKYECSQAGAV